MWYSNVCHTTFPAKFTSESNIKQYLFILYGDFINITIMTVKKRVQNKLSKLMIVSKVESLWISVKKWMTDAVVFICTFIYRFTYQFHFSSICHLYKSVCNFKVNVIFLFPDQVLFPATNVLFALGAWHVISVSWSIYYFWTNFKNEVPSCVIIVCDMIPPM